MLRRLDGSLRCGEIAKRDDADEPLIAVHHRQTPHLDVRHILSDLVQVLVTRSSISPDQS